MRLKSAVSFFVHAVMNSLCILLFAEAAWAQSAEPLLPPETVRPPAEETLNPVANEKIEKRGESKILLGGVTAFQPHSLLGKWNGHIRRFGRHPKLYIDYCQDGKITGSYKGIFGRFPVSGYYSDQTGDITIHVDFSSSPLTKLRKLRSGHGVIQANIKDGVLVGRASIADLGPRSVRWEAVKEKDKSSVMTNDEADAGAQK